jgi:hypothetical protein
MTAVAARDQPLGLGSPSPVRTTSRARRRGGRRAEAPARRRLGLGPQRAVDRYHAVGRGVAGPLGARDPGASAQPRAEHLPLNALRPRSLSRLRGRSPDRAGPSSQPGLRGRWQTHRGAQGRTHPDHRPSPRNASDGAGVTDAPTNTPAARLVGRTTGVFALWLHPTLRSTIRNAYGPSGVTSAGGSWPGTSRVETSW